MHWSPEVARRVDCTQARGDAPTVAVVGGGVSGCACAAVLARAGVRALVLNSALDSVGLPGYGPDLIAGEGGWEEIERTLAVLPAPLREAWLNAASVPENGAAVLTVDRRAVSIETKRALERLSGLEFRQGLVTWLSVAPDVGQGSVAAADERLLVETAFGEAIEAEAVVVAVGLGLGGRVTVGADVLSGGRYGEIPADGILEALESMGATFSEVEFEVGVRFSCTRWEELALLAGLGGGRVGLKTLAARTFAEGSGGKCPTGLKAASEAMSRALQRERAESGGEDGSDRDDCEGGLWPEGYPPAAHWTEALRSADIVLDTQQSPNGAPVLSPDGMATAEFYLAPQGGCVSGLEGDGFGGGPVNAGMASSRPGQRVNGLAVSSLDPGGRLTVKSGEKPRIWVAGRAAGATGYLDSLLSGARVGRAVAAYLAETYSGPSGTGEGAGGASDGGPAVRVDRTYGAAWHLRGER